MSSWLKRYMEYTHRSEAPEEFHFWTGVATIAATLERNVWADTGHGYFVYPNMYTVLVAKSGLKKSSAAEFGPPLAEEAGVPVFKEQITPQALLKHLKGNMVIQDGEILKPAASWLFTTEMSVLMSRSALQSGLLGQLTGMYLCPSRWQYETITRGKDYLYNVCINMLGATVPNLFKMWVEEALMGGFMARLMLVWGMKPRKRPLFYIPTMRELDLRDELMNELKGIRKLSGQTVVSDECKKFLEAWYENRQPPEDERLGGFYEREHDHVLKVATVLAVSEYGEPHINIQQAEAAIIAVENLKQGLHYIYAGLGSHALVEGLSRVEDQIKMAGEKGMSMAELLKKNWYTLRKDELEEVLGTLLSAEKLKITHTPRGIRYVWHESK